jgi:hypothetical protein
VEPQPSITIALQAPAKLVEKLVQLVEKLVQLVQLVEKQAAGCLQCLVLVHRRRRCGGDTT